MTEKPKNTLRLPPAGDHIIPFGKYRGKRLCEAPFLYSVWVVTRQGIRVRDRAFYFAAVRWARKVMEHLHENLAPSPRLVSSESFRVKSVSELLDEGNRYDDLC